ncbi:MAG: hypothetical protein ABIA75_08060 [Candidatus Neomarinimicrobiota bacterium]
MTMGDILDEFEFGRDDQLEPFDGRPAENGNKIHRRTVIIKNGLVRKSDPVRVRVSGNGNETFHQGYIQPLMQGNQIVGVVNTCACGKVTEIRFDFAGVDYQPEFSAD